MSAIWGAISLTGKAIPQKHIGYLRKAYDDCVIDRYEETYGDGVYMGAGIQYITGEAKYETAPKNDNGYYFNSDVIIDNRDELLELLHINDKAADIPDGDILFRMIHTYGTDKLPDILGAYTFVAYDSNTNTITIAADAVGNRFVHYLNYDGILYYSSLMKPLQYIIGTCKMNNRWVADFIGQDNLNMFTECEETPIKEIYRVAPAQCITICPDGISRKIYWNPYKTKKLRLKNDEAYKDYFLKLYTQCVECVLRSEGETSILLSAGYDSTSVAVLAANALQRSGKKLYGFTSVPYKGYKSDFETIHMTDETEAVLKTRDYVPNLECAFMDMPDMNCWFDRTEYMSIAEMPYKSPQNLLWMYEGYKQSKNIGSRIMLGGMFGNGTVSYDNAQIYLRDLCRRGHFIKLYQEAVGLNKRHHYTKKSVLKTAMKQALDFRKPVKSTRESMFGKTYAKKAFLEKNGAVKRLFDRQAALEKSTFVERKIHENMLAPDIFRHYGEFALRNSLYTGVIVRDPTRDKRMVEFTLSIPPDQFTHDGYMRRLISDYMKEYVPEHIINETRRGRQSADMKARIVMRQEEIKRDWLANYKRFAANDVIDCDRAYSDLKDRKIEDMPEMDIFRHIFTNIMLEYMHSNGFC